MKGLLAALGVVAALLVGVLLYSMLSPGDPPVENGPGDSSSESEPRGKTIDPGPKPRGTAGSRAASASGDAPADPAGDTDENAVDLDARFPVADCIDPPRPTENGELDAESQRALVGRVVEPEGLGVANARVVATPRGNPNERVETSTASDGTFRVVVASADDDRDLEVTHDEYGRKTFRVRPSRRTETGIEVPVGDLLLERAGTISGVVQIAGGTPGAGLEIILNGPLAGVMAVSEVVAPGYQFAMQRAKPDGSFAFEKLAPGRYSIEVHPGRERGLADVQHDVELASGQDLRDVVIVLRPTGQVEIFVLDGDGRPVAGVGVSIELLESTADEAAAAASRRPGSLTVATDVAGHATFSNAAPGRYRAQVDGQAAKATEESPHEFEIGDGTGAPVRLTIVVRRSQSISGRVVDSNGDPVTGLAVVCTATSHAPESNAQVRTGLTGPQGEFIVSGLLEAEYRVDVMDLTAPPESQILATREGVSAGSMRLELAVTK